MASSRYGRVHKRFSWVLLALLAMSIPANGLLFPFAIFDQNEFLLAVSTGLFLSWFLIAGVAVALLDLNPLKRVLFALLIPTVVFRPTLSLGIWLARQLYPSVPTSRSSSLEVLMIPLLCMSVAWMLWVLRICRSWRLTRQLEPEIDGDLIEHSRILEAVCLFVCLAAAVGLFSIENMFWAALGLIAGGGVVAVVIVVPVTFWLMKTRRYWQVWLLISFGVPQSILIGFGLYQIEEYAQSGYMFTEEAIVATILVFVFLFPLSAFLLALRIQGFRLNYSEPWKRKLSPHKPIKADSRPHPLDD